MIIGGGVKFELVIIFKNSIQKINSTKKIQKFNQNQLLLNY